MNALSQQQREMDDMEIDNIFRTNWSTVFLGAIVGGTPLVYGASHLNGPVLWAVSGLSIILGVSFAENARKLDKLKRYLKEKSSLNSV
ncbi:MAG TPA: hypothetical protein VGZ93_07160 [Candidatus Methylacidiphilales bacterium]|nr:hypothetical protein [Candidatus Methylacidiphilales bacterium]